MLQTHGTFFQRGTRCLSLSGSLNCRKFMLKKEKEKKLKNKEEAQLSLKTRKKIEEKHAAFNGCMN